MTGPRGGYQLGIDLGTTFTAAAVCRSDDRQRAEPEVVSLGSRSATVPSVLFLAPDGAVVVGEAAERRAHTDPDRVVREVKRRIGDPTPIVVAGRAHAPEELSALLVRWVVDRVAEREGGPAARIAVTHPASWGPHKRDLLAGALGAHGLTATFLAEPQAAALHYAAAERVEPGSTIAVYDLGGGTFDAAVVRKAEPGRPGEAFGLLGRPEGLERLGGIDFDEVVFEHVRGAMPEAFAALDPADPAVLSAVARIRRDCTEAKEALSADTEVTIPVLLPEARGAVRLHRSEFESMVRPLVEETVKALRGAVTSAELTPEQLTAVLLVGGSSRIPLVTQLVSEGLGRPVAVDADPKNAIAKGAALAVSPEPAASRNAAAVALAGAGAAAGATARALPTAPPPRPAPTPPRGVVRMGGPAREPAAPLFARPEPGAAPQRPAVRPVDRDPGAVAGPASGRRGGLLVGAGALVAAAVVVAAIVLLGDSAAVDGTGSGGSGPVPSLGGQAGTTTPAGEPGAPAAPAPDGGGAPAGGGAAVGGGAPAGGGGTGGGAPAGGGAGGGAPAGGGAGGGGAGGAPADGGAAPGPVAPPGDTEPDPVPPVDPGPTEPTGSNPDPDPAPDPSTGPEPPTGGTPPGGGTPPSEPGGEPPPGASGPSTPPGDPGGGGDGTPDSGGTVGTPVGTDTAAGGSGSTPDPAPAAATTV